MRRGWIALATLLAASAALAQPTPAPGAEAERWVVLHTVRPDDTLALLSAEYYGKRELAVFIMVQNDMTHPRPLRPGERLRIPTAWKYQAVAGDALEDLAERWLGDRRRAPYLADFNGLPAGAALVEGQELTVPFHLTHTAAERERLEDVATAFYGPGGATKAELLRGYNFRQSRMLKKGESVIVPIESVRVRPEKLPAPDAAAAARDQRRREATARAREALPRVREAWLEGDYEGVKRKLADLDFNTLEPAVGADVGFLLGSAYVAFGDEVSARAQFKKVLERSPDHEVRADRISPKITAVWEQVGGRVARPVK